MEKPKFKIGDKVIVTLHQKITHIFEGTITAAEYSIRWNECFYTIEFSRIDRKGHTRKESLWGITEDSITLK